MSSKIIIFQLLIGSIFSSRLLLISLDGFRWDYLKKYKQQTKNLQSLSKLGLKSTWIQDQFLTKTFPNHWTIVTGLYEESHGIINNNFWDPKFNQTFIYSKDDKFWSGEPIWKSLELQTDRKAAAYFWPGSDVEIMAPSFYKTPYDKNIPYNVRLNQIINWLKNPEISLTTFYITEPDHSGHIYGPNSDQVRDAIQNVDNMIGEILLQVQNNWQNYQDLNIIITSDHGMTHLYEDKVVILDKILPKDAIDKIGKNYVDFYTGGHVWCEDDENVSFNCDYFYKNLLNKNKNLKIFKKNQIPDRYHYRDHYRIPPLLILAKLPYQVHLNNDYKRMKGTHGYDPDEQDMHPIFIAAGADIKKFDDNVEPFNSINLYELFCKILKINPAPNNGSLSNINHLLKPKQNFNWSNLSKIYTQKSIRTKDIFGYFCCFGGFIFAYISVFCMEEDERGEMNKINFRKQCPAKLDSKLNQFEEKYKISYENRGFDEDVSDNFSENKLLPNVEVFDDGRAGNRSRRTSVNSSNKIYGTKVSKFSKKIKNDKSESIGLINV